MFYRRVFELSQERAQLVFCIADRVLSKICASLVLHEFVVDLAAYLLAAWTSGSIHVEKSGSEEPKPVAKDGMRHRELCMESMEKVTGTIFVVKEDQEFCFLFDRDDPIDLYRALFRCTELPDSGLTREEVMEVIEGMVQERLRSI